MQVVFRRQGLIFLFALLGFLLEAVAQPSLKVVNGRVKEVRLEREELVLTSQNPVTGQEEEWVLKVENGTGFSEGTFFEELEGGDPVSVDYQQEGEGPARAVFIKRVPVRGVPIDKKSLP